MQSARASRSKRMTVTKEFPRDEMKKLGGEERKQTLKESQCLNAEGKMSVYTSHIKSFATFRLACLSNNRNWMWWSSSFLASRCAFGPTCFILLFSCVFSEQNGNMFLFKPLTVSCRVPLSRWAVQSCSAASVNNCFDLHPRSWLPVSPCWDSDASCFRSLGNDVVLLGCFTSLICHFIVFINILNSFLFVRFL